MKEKGKIKFSSGIEILYQISIFPPFWSNLSKICIFSPRATEFCRNLISFQKYLILNEKSKRLISEQVYCRRGQSYFRTINPCTLSAV
jgi:hypothetical protein